MGEEGEGGGGGVYTEKKFFLCLKSYDLICFKILVFRNNWIRFCAKILIVNSKAILCMGRRGVYVCVCVCGGEGGGSGCKRETILL